MVSLLLKDLKIATGRHVSVVVGVFLLATLQTLPFDEMYFWLGVALAAGLVAIVPVVEWMLDTDPMLCSLPVRRATIVRARYVAAVLAGGVAVVLWTATGHLLGPLLDAGRTTAPWWASFGGIASFVVVVGVLAAIFLPLYFRFGLGRGAAVFAFTCLALLIGASSLASLVGGGAAPAVGAALDGGALVTPARSVRLAIGHLQASVGAGWTLALVLTGVAVGLTASAWQAVRAFERRDF